MKKFLRDTRGAALWEYALLVIVGLIAAGAIVALARQAVNVFTAAEQALKW